MATTTPTAADVRAFRALDAISEHLRTCPRWWFPEPGRTLHCAEHLALSDAFHEVMVQILREHRDSVTDALDLDRQITQFHRDWGVMLAAWTKSPAQRVRRLARRLRPGRTATHTPVRPPWLAAYDTVST